MVNDIDVFLLIVLTVWLTRHVAVITANDTEDDRSDCPVLEW
jgi:hypothetical protein